MKSHEINVQALYQEIDSLKQRIHELELTLKVSQDENIRRRDILETSRDNLQKIIDNIGDPVLVIDRGYRVVLANQKVREMNAGVDPVKEGLFCYQVSHKRQSPCSGRNERCPIKGVIKKKSSVRVTHTHFDSSGNRIIVDITASPVIDRSGGEVTHIIESCKDITEKRRIEEALRESERRYRSLFEQSGDAIFLIQAEGPDKGKILSANKSACKMYGYSEKEMRRMYISELETTESRMKIPRHIRKTMEGKTLRTEVMHRRKDGTVFPVEVTATVIKAGKKSLILAMKRDISDRKEAERERELLIKKLEYTSQTDGLTGLLNRQHLDLRLKEEMRRAGRYENPLTIVMFDIDKFKKINDAHGHVVGDRILKKVAMVVKKTLRETDIAGRFGGDEFVLILVQTPLEVARQVAERIRREIEKVRIAGKKKDVYLLYRKYGHLPLR
jgi:diguanylate cyclase (GGDEF)-like protein/PAS domain S-box-containing protein